MKRRAILIVLDSVGIGEMPDAARFGDAGSDTLGNIIKQHGLHAPNMVRMGLSRIDGISFREPGDASGAYGKCAEMSDAKDTTMGHWELMGILAPPFRTFPDGFPPQIMQAFEQAIGRGTLGNTVASGTEIIQRLGDEHVATGKPIIYTSADSVFQIAAHEGVIPLEELYAMCQTARELLVGDYATGRIIARPFVGESGAYARTENRRDFALPPPEDTVLDQLVKDGKSVLAIGKIEDIFAKRGMTKVNHTTNNDDGINATVAAIKAGEDDFIFTNLVDFDMLYGHRNDVAGYAGALERFDARLPEILGALLPGDVLMITADHGCDPTTKSTDHSREYVPLLVQGAPVKAGVNLGVRTTFADVGASVYDYLTGGAWKLGTSFIPDITKQ